MYRLTAQQVFKSRVCTLAIGTLALVVSSEAFALPSFARQTGENCDSCHVGSFGPQLTPHGMKFKIGGYTESDGKPGHIPLAGMVVENFTHTKKGQDPVPADGFKSNNNIAIQEESLFVAGKWFDHVGSFAQITYSGIEHRSSLDNTDIRYATEFGEGTFGVSLNNNPTVQDPFNTLPAWGFPYTGSELAPGPGLVTLLGGVVGGQALGATAYVQLANGIYAEMGGYHALTKGFLDRVGVGADAEVKGLAPYYRVAYFQDLKSASYSVGLVGMSAKLRDYEHINPAEKFNDVGIDAHYQFLGNRKNIFSVNAAYIHEKKPEDVKQFNLAGSYYFDKTYGATLGYFSLKGEVDDGTGTSTMVKADSNGWTIQGDWTPWGKEGAWNAPWANVRLGLQYTIYNKLNGASGSAAKDANTLMGFAWLSI